MSEETWDLLFVLPNLRFRGGNEEEAKVASRLAARHIALVAPDDPRVLMIRRRWPAAEKLIGGFHDSSGARVWPAVLICEREARPTVSREAIVAFRNAMTLAVALPSWLARDENAQFIYSDVFDFYPTTLAIDGGTLITISPALRAYWSPTATFVGMSSPYVTRVTFMRGEDTYLRHVLTEEWERAFVAQGGDDSFPKAVFRSLELAYAALATPVKNQGSLYDSGVNLSLWVSALEVLAHPHATAEEGDVNQVRVLDLLSSYGWLRDRMRTRSQTITLGGQPRLVNLVELACHRLYRLRHHFMHGDTVASSDLWPFGEQVASLIQIAPTLYRLTLRAFLGGRHPRYDGVEPVDLTWERRDAIAALAADHHLETQVGELFDVVSEGI